MNTKLLAAVITLVLALALPCTALAAQPSTPDHGVQAPDAARAAAPDTAIAPLVKKAKLVKKRGLYSVPGSYGENLTTAKVKGNVLTMKGPLYYQKSSRNHYTSMRKATYKFKIAKSVKFYCHVKKTNTYKRLTVVKHNARANETLKNTYGLRLTVKGRKVIKMEFTG